MSAKNRGEAGNRAFSFFVLLLIAGIIGVAVNTFIVQRDAGYDAEYRKLAGEIRVLAQQVATASRLATAGEAEAFDTLSTSRSNLNATITKGGNGRPKPQNPICFKFSLM